MEEEGVAATVDPGDALTRWSVRFAVAFYVLALALRVTARGRRHQRATARLAWWIGWAFLIVHVLFAFQFFHSWSHAEAYDSTARRTNEVVGWNWGGGLWVNYLFVIVWFADAVWWTLGLDRYESRPRWVELLIQGFLAFIVINAVVVF